MVINAAGNNRNNRNGRSKKMLKGDCGELPIEIPNDQIGPIEPQLITRHQTRWSGFDDKYCRYDAACRCARFSVTCRKCRRRGIAHVDFIGDRAVMYEVKVWQSRPLDAL